MPIYEFRCDKCHNDFEELTGSNSAAPVCPNCGSDDTRRIMSACARHRGTSDSGYSAPSGGGCAGCSGGNCASCGH